MRKLTTLFKTGLMLCVIASCNTAPKDNSLSADESKEGWVLLFDGNSLNGWHLYNHEKTPSAWQIKDGAIYCSTDPKVEHGDLISDKEYSNYDLKFEWRLPKAGNSGVFINVLERKDIPTAWASGPEYQLLGAADPDQALPMKRAGCLYSFSAQLNPVSVKPDQGWNESRITQQNGKIEFYLNGVKTAEEDFSSSAWKLKVADSHFKMFPEFGQHTSGHIGLQDWTKGVEFKNIKIKVL